MEFCILKKFNNSIATKLCPNLLNNRLKKSALHNSMTELYGALFKCDNKQKIGWEINAQLCSALKWERV